MSANSLQFRLTVNIDGAAYTDSAENEIARILRVTACRLEGGDDFSTYRNLLDGIGNVVGSAALKTVEEHEGGRRSMRQACVVAALLLSFTLSAPAWASEAPKAPTKPKPPTAQEKACQPVTIAGQTVYARRTEGGNLSTAACEPEITLRITDRAPKTLSGYVVRSVTAYSCAIWIRPESFTRPEVLSDATQECVDRMHARAESLVR